MSDVRFGLSVFTLACWLLTIVFMARATWTLRQMNRESRRERSLYREVIRREKS